ILVGFAERGEVEGGHGHRNDQQRTGPGEHDDGSSIAPSAAWGGVFLGEHALSHGFQSRLPARLAASCGSSTPAILPPRSPGTSGHGMWRSGCTRPVTAFKGAHNCCAHWHIPLPELETCPVVPQVKLPAKSDWVPQLIMPAKF